MPNGSPGAFCSPAAVPRAQRSVPRSGASTCVARSSPLPGREFCPANRTPSGAWRLPWYDDPGLAWLAARRAGETVNLTGPYGSGFPLLPLTRRLLLVADAPHLGIVLPLVDEALDRGGQVSLLLLDGGPAPAAVDALRGELPLAVEFHRLAAEGWQQEIDGGLRWSDQVCTAIAAAHLPAVADAIRRIRVRFDAGFAFSFVDADLACGYGACLACVVPLPTAISPAPACTALSLTCWS